MKTFQSVAPTIVLIVGVLRKFIYQERIVKMSNERLEEALKRENNYNLDRIANALENLLRLLEDESKRYRDE
tara:strand:- start:212 stop:427 length:216 start_codon:yes stop_codon:yes gene_type:complete